VWREVEAQRLLSGPLPRFHLTPDLYCAGAAGSQASAIDEGGAAVVWRDARLQHRRAQRSPPLRLRMAAHCSGGRQCCTGAGAFTHGMQRCLRRMGSPAASSLGTQSPPLLLPDPGRHSRCRQCRRRLCLAAAVPAHPLLLQLLARLAATSQRRPVLRGRRWQLGPTWVPTCAPTGAAHLRSAIVVNRMSGAMNTCPGT
jgi:hypothetical protein